ncbi:golgin subfamily A member 5-like isoform X1 [Carcharodon carcharias]|uniref:golgin subfamily A member 5-like isoform X1 n=2 Tax=Carcharodon carcharias TaxID=13397 RepID=UPI001B7EA761|nr:golgin subfamily A member 5-like isoform X1 [Carcharodon carcharias]XP_041033252.1 golgin subfamily A member 5-like isoform X1 [Carcharodon carcharias]XP_041033253.1 golgin subfamily A member 5-like isoform X1 [Carcharodon carcharias]XP_041033254.1 golgin subfamily A member 5-like isoform X1 [Carcharodon carcharias]
MNTDISLMSRIVTDSDVDTMQTLKFGGCHQKDPTFNKVRSFTEAHSGSPSDSKHLMDELEVIKFHIEVQTRTIESLNQTVSLLAKERSHHQQQIRLLEAEVRRLSMSSNIEEDRINLMIDRKIEDWKKELSSNLTKAQEAVQQTENQVQTTETSSHAEELAAEIHESKKFLWEECESLRKEIEQINRKLTIQEDDLLSSLTDCKILRQNQKKYNQILERLIQRCRQVQSLDPEQELKDIKLAMIDMQEQIQNLCYSNKQNNTIARIKRGRSIECTRKELMVKHLSNASDSDTDTW